jgi:hypothetical protein
MSATDKLFSKQTKYPIGGLVRDDEVIAAEACRIILTISGDLTEKENKITVKNIYALFNRLYGAEAIFTSINVNGTSKSSIKAVTQKSEEIINDFIIKTTNSISGTGFRRYGALVKDSKIPMLPYACIEVGSDNFGPLLQMEFALPAHNELYKSFIAQLEIELSDLKILVGVIGFGWFLPPMYNSLNGLLIADFYENKTKHNSLGIRTNKELFNYAVREPIPTEYKKHAVPAGIPDIGWKTLVGKHLLTTNLDLLKKFKENHKFSITESSHYYCITAGSSPIWGDEVEADDLRDYYSQIADLLEPIYNSPKIAIQFCHGFSDSYLPYYSDSDFTTEEHKKIIASYFKRF